MMTKRSYYCGDVTEQATGETVLLKGWVQKRRDLGGLIFIDLRDRGGVVQVVFNPEKSAEALKIAEDVRNEFVLEVQGTVVAREEGTVNPNLKTGKIEVSEDVRLKYRYLDLRRSEMFNTLKMRNDITKTIRDFLDQNDFLDVETPILTKSTPEGARDYLVPSRVHEGEFYALPQSPQIFKQLLMVSGVERYYQIARCFRDEDLRADRQPEFTQIDIETSFLSQEDIMTMTEEMMSKVMKRVKDLDVTTPFPRMSYDEAMSRYGSDKPDTRFEMELVNLSELVKDCGFKVFSAAVENGGEVKAINVKGAASSYSRKDIDALTEFVKIYGAKGLAWLKVEADGLKGPIAKFFNEDEQKQFAEALQTEEGDLLLFVADKKSVVADALGALRLKLAKEQGI